MEWFEVEALKMAKYNFVLAAGEHGLELPPFKSSAFRGGFGHVFKALACSRPNGTCEECLYPNTCPYTYVFETKPPQDSKILKNYESVPRPYIISTKFDDQKTRFSPGEQLQFSLYLFGDAIAYTPYFIHAFERLGQIGIGKQRRPYTLVRVEAQDVVNNLTYRIYEGRQKVIHPRDVTVTGHDFLRRAEFVNTDVVTVKFQTPLRIKWQGAYTSDPQFHILIRNTIRRITSLLYFHHSGQELDLDIAALLRKAERVELKENRTKWVDWERYSARQDTKMSLGGIIGEAVYQGDLQEFVPYLLAAGALHIGKQTAFGLGDIELIFGS